MASSSVRSQMSPTAYRTPGHGGREVGRDGVFIEIFRTGICAAMNKIKRLVMSAKKGSVEGLVVFIASATFAPFRG